MREIKFRAWDEENNLMIYFEPLKSNYTNGFWGDENNYRLECERDFSPKERCYNHDDFNCEIDLIIMQFTGLHDKNGKEIYEGDIVLIREGIAVITFYCGSFWCDFWTMLLLSDRCVEVEVIGNIHENPELIK